MRVGCQLLSRGRLKPVLSTGRVKGEAHAYAGRYHLIGLDVN
jgi:hypothetical protein